MDSGQALCVKTYGVPAPYQKESRDKEIRNKERECVEGKSAMGQPRRERGGCLKALKRRLLSVFFTHGH